MTVRFCGLGAAFAVAIVAVASGASASVHPLVTVGENGLGSVDFCAPGCPEFMPGVMAPDPGPDGAASALTYDLLSPPSLVAGDLLIYKNGVLHADFRFNASDTSAVFYAVTPPGGAAALAQGPLPSTFYANQAAVSTVGSKAFYNPTAGQPGYVAGFNAGYAISTPEPSTWAMLLLGLGGMGAMARRRRASARAGA
jgi:hypothetical protein